MDEDVDSRERQGRDMMGTREITINVAEPTAELLTEVRTKGYGINGYLPPRKRRKNSRKAPSRYGCLMLTVDDEPEVFDTTKTIVQSHHIIWQSVAARCAKSG
jgi:hypothetical protein